LKGPASHAFVDPRRTRWRTAAIVGAAALALLTACGASVSAVYEGDVRFERCMSLDWAPNVDPVLRRGCWEEWERYYTLGQNRDRIEYARAQLQKLQPSAKVVEPTDKPLLAVPEPTSVFAPPPMMLGGPDAGPSGSGADAAAPQAAASECEAKCDARHDECRSLCRGAVCDKACAAKRSRCLERCP
jgi:hypothetical protein